MTEWSNRFLILLGALGIYITGTLSWTTLKKLEIPCGGTLDCNLVQDSPFANFPVGDNGIPVAYIGLAGYILLFALALVRSTVTGTTHRRLAIAGFVMSAIGLVFSLWLTFASIAILQLKCIWCLSSLGVIVLMTIGHAALIQGGIPEKPDVRTGWSIGAATFVMAMIGLGFSVKGLGEKINAGDILLDKSIPIEQAAPDASKMTNAPNAKVTVLEFADLNCPACRSNYAGIKKALNKYGSNVRFAFRSLPLLDKPGHETSLDAAILAELAAEKGIFWKYIDTMFLPENKERIKDQEGLIAVAVEAGLTREEILGMKEKGENGAPSTFDRMVDRVDADIRMATKLGVQQTPTLIVYAEGQKPTIVLATSLESTLDSSPYRELMK